VVLRGRRELGWVGLSATADSYVMTNQKGKGNGNGNGNGKSQFGGPSLRSRMTAKNKQLQEQRQLQIPTG